MGSQHTPIVWEKQGHTIAQWPKSLIVKFSDTYGSSQVLSDPVNYAERWEKRGHTIVQRPKSLIVKFSATGTMWNI